MGHQVDVLLANEPATYRELLASELPHLRPALCVRAADPGELDAVVAALSPRLVICSRPTTSVEAHATAVIVLYPNGGDQVFINMGGATRVMAAPRLPDLLAAIDATIDRIPDPGLPTID